MSTSTTHTSGPPTSGCHVNDPHFWTTYIWLSCQRPTLLDHLHLVVMSTTHTSGPPTSGCHVNDPHLWTTCQPQKVETHVALLTNKTVFELSNLIPSVKSVI